MVASISWKKYLEQCGRERLQGKRGPTPQDIAVDLVLGAGREGLQKEHIVTGISMCTGIIADEVGKHWDEIEAALVRRIDIVKRRGGNWCRKSRSGRA